MKEQIHYHEVMDLNFKREDIVDNTFFKKNGYHCFYVFKKIDRGLHAVWDCETKTVDLVRYDDQERVQGRLPISGIKELRRFVKFFSSKKTRNF